MRILLLILTLTGLLAACSDNGDGQPDAGAESAEQQEEVDSGNKDSKEPEAGEPVNEPTPPEPESSNESDGDEAARDSEADAAETDTGNGNGDAEASDNGSGEEVAAVDIYERYCVACHEQGMAGAPKLSNTAEWEKRIEERGLDGLVSNSWDGYRAMPAKGTCSDCSREEIRATVEWMLDQAEVSF